MAEPNSTLSLSATTGIGLAAMLPGINGDALIGAFAGAVLFVVTAKEIGRLTRFAYFVVSLLAGYLAAPELLGWLPIKSVGLSALIAAATIVTLTLRLIEGSQTVNLDAWLKRGGPR